MSTPTHLALLGAALLLAGCTQEQQNKLGRDIQNWTGTNGVLEVYAGDKLVRRFVRVDKLSTALGTGDSEPRAYRYGYGTEYVGWVVNRVELLERAAELGLELERELVLDAWLSAAGAPEDPIGHRGFLFRVNGGSAAAAP